MTLNLFQNDINEDSNLGNIKNIEEEYTNDPTEDEGVVTEGNDGDTPVPYINQTAELYGPERCGPILKVKLPYGKYNNEREIRPPYTRRIPGEKKFILDMVDSLGNSYAMALPDCSIVSAIALTPAPESLTINSSKIISRYHTMTRWVEEHWGDEIDTITFSGGTYGLFEYYTDGENRGAGLTAVKRRKTEPYKMLKEVARLYKSNGMLYHDEKTYDDSSLTNNFLKDAKNSYFLNNHPRKGLPKERLYIKLFYDYITCLGYIESFDVIEDESTPFRIKYSISYKAEKTVWNQGMTATKLVDTRSQTG